MVGLMSNASYECGRYPANMEHAAPHATMEHVRAKRDALRLDRREPCTRLRGTCFRF